MSGFIATILAVHAENPFLECFFGSVAFARFALAQWRPPDIRYKFDIMIDAVIYPLL
jgi:hypothetical protein